MILIAAECGLRSSDIIWLRFDEINWDKKLISKTQHKTGIHVNVPFTEQVQFLLLDYLKNHRLFIKILRKQVSNGDAGNVVPIH